MTPDQTRALLDGAAPDGQAREAFDAILPAPSLPSLADLPEGEQKNAIGMWAEGVDEAGACLTGILCDYHRGGVDLFLPGRKVKERRRAWEPWGGAPAAVTREGNMVEGASRMPPAPCATSSGTRVEPRLCWWIGKAA